MANWAKLQEDLTGLKVVKRARNGIHFDKGGGQILANFSGKPCHFLDGKIWKPIDTKLLVAGDGYYGCPHSPVKISKDGRVKVDGSDYQQFTELPSAKAGVLDGDRIVRTFSFGEQRMWITEDGYRSEIELTRIPTLAEARKLITSESGTFDKAYLKSLTTARDSSGDNVIDDNVHTITSLSAFRTWLAKAKYPVVIDPDFTANTNIYNISGGSSVYATARSTSFSYGTAAGGSIFIGQRWNDPNYVIYRAYLYFDTSSIGAGSTVTQANYSGGIVANYASDAYDVEVVGQDWSEWLGDITNATKRETAYDGSLSGTSAGVWINTGTSKTRRTKYTSANLTTTIITVAGTTYISLRSSLDVAGTAPDSDERIYIFEADEATYTDCRPILSVTYTAGGVPKQYLHYARLRG